MKLNSFNKQKLLKKLSTVVAVVMTAGFTTYVPTKVNIDVGIVAEAYSNGNYKVNTSSGVNVRSGAGTGYSKVGAATNKTSFTVDQVSGSWGHTNSIKCTNGTKSGWICLDYCSKTADSNSGSNSSLFQTGTYKVYNCSALNVRTGPGTDYSSKGTVSSGTYLYITSKSGNWGYAKNKSGYVSMSYCTFVSSSDLTGGGSSGGGGATKSYTTPLTNGTTYHISPACATNSYIDVSGGNTGNGTNILIWSKHGGKNQQFKAVYISNGYYAFYDVNSGKVIDVSGGIAANCRNVQLYQYNGTAAQLWRLYDAGNGYYYLQSKINSNYYLDVNGAASKDGTNVHLYKGNSSSAQKFKFIRPNSNNSNGKISLAVPSYKQGDSRWKNTPLGKYDTIGKSGCIVTSVAMAYSYNKNKTYYPNTVNNMLQFTDDGCIYWGSVSACGMKSYSKGKTSITQSIMKEMYNSLKAGRPVVIWCSNSSGRAHAVCVTGYSGSTSTFSASGFSINDPGYSRTNLQQHLNYVDQVRYLIY